MTQSDYAADHLTQEQMESEWDREMYEAEMGTLDTDPEPWWTDQVNSFVGPCEPLDFAF